MTGISTINNGIFQGSPLAVDSVIRTLGIYCYRSITSINGIACTTLFALVNLYFIWEVDGFLLKESPLGFFIAQDQLAKARIKYAVCTVIDIGILDPESLAGARIIATQVVPYICGFAPGFNLQLATCAHNLAGVIQVHAVGG